MNTHPPPQHSVEQKRHSVLLVDDDPQLIQVLATWLRDEGFEVELAFDGLRGLDIAALTRPDLVVSDISMPHMDGVTLAARLEKLQIPVILISANPRPAALGTALSFLRKPFDLADFMDMVRHCLRNADSG